MQQHNNTMMATPVIRGHIAFLAGVTWEPVSSRDRKNIKGLARRLGADHIVTYRYRDNEGQAQFVAGLVRRSTLTLPRKIKGLYSLGLLIASQQIKSGYAIVPLETDKFAFVSSIDGVLINDVVSSRLHIEQARETFTQFNPEPKDGWQCFAPTDWHIDGSQPFNLDSFLNGRRFPVSSRFYSASMKKTLFSMAAFGIVVLVSYCGWTLYSDYQEAIRQEAVRQAILAQQQENISASSVIIPPWITQPRLKNFVDTCAARWQAAPISLAGWIFKEAQCSQEGSIRFAYALPDGGNVRDFAHRVKQTFAEHPYFNLPGNGDIGGFNQSILFEIPADKRELPKGEVQIQRLTTFAQQMRLPIILQEEDNRIVTPSGEESVLPWRTFSLSLDTTIPPTQLFEGIDDIGIRLNQITLVLSQGRLNYKIEGKLYAKQ